MYHTEGFLDDSTYFTKGHIWSFQIAQGENLCYFWCVSKAEVKDESGILTQRLSRWFRQELVPCLEKGQVSIQRELNRLGEQLNACREKYGLKERPMLHLYMQGKLYHYGMEDSSMSQRVFHCETEDKRAIEAVANQLKVDLLKAQSTGLLKWGYFLLWEDSYDF